MSKPATSATGRGKPAFRRCPVCHRDVLSAYRGEVTACGTGRILSIASDGAVIGECGGCGKRVTWEREGAAGP